MRTTALKEIFSTEIHAYTEHSHYIYIYIHTTLRRIKQLKISVFQCIERKRNFTKCHTINGTLSESVFLID